MFVKAGDGFVAVPVAKTPLVDDEQPALPLLALVNSPKSTPFPCDCISIYSICSLLSAPGLPPPIIQRPLLLCVVVPFGRVI